MTVPQKVDAAILPFQTIFFITAFCSTCIITDGLSGSSKVKFENVPEEIQGKFNSTVVVIEIPNNDGFTATLKTSTGAIKTEYDGTIIKERKGLKKIYTLKYLNESKQYNFESVSSNILIEMK